jgi:hypothetical protein
MSNLIEFAKTMRAYIEKASTVLEDSEALKAIYLFLIIFFHVLPFVLFFMQI